MRNDRIESKMWANMHTGNMVEIHDRNKHQNNPLMSAETVRYSSTCIILYDMNNWSIMLQ